MQGDDTFAKTYAYTLYYFVNILCYCTIIGAWIPGMIDNRFEWIRTIEGSERARAERREFIDALGGDDAVRNFPYFPYPVGAFPIESRTFVRWDCNPEHYRDFHPDVLPRGPILQSHYSGRSYLFLKLEKISTREQFVEVLVHDSSGMGDYCFSNLPTSRLFTNSNPTGVAALRDRLLLQRTHVISTIITKRQLETLREVIQGRHPEYRLLTE